MNEKYDHKEIEKKWQKEWEKKGVYKALDKSKKPKYYVLVEFPYPSGDGLHVGHPRPYIGLDLIARKRRMEGYNVLYPMGWDAFGLPTENYALKTGRQPEEVTKKNIDNFRRQIKLLGTSFDWSREINTTDPKYYKWTQWLFLQFLKHDLAYKAKISINWCPKDKIGLANEEVVGGKCERCGSPVEKREKEQWMLRITKYADRLDKDLDKVDYLEKIRLQQRNWIGRSEGTEFEFRIKNHELSIKVFTTRADTLFGITYLVVAPEHPIIENLKLKIENWDEVEKYIQETKKKTEIERAADEKEKTGVELKGVKAVNPASGEEVPVFVADYVLGNYGTGAVMAVPAHDERDFAFAQKYGLPIKYVILPRMVDTKNPHVPGKEIVFRNGIMAILRNPKTKKILCLKWKKQPWTTFIMGGIEEGEDPVQAGLREIAEETGYKRVKLVKVLGGPTQTEFYAAHKGINRIAHTWAIEYELESEERDEISAEENEIHELVWVNENDIRAEEMAHVEAGMVLEKMKNGMMAYTGEGILKYSGEFNGLSSEEAREKITKKFGQKVVKYKLRDWVFSRQRYWGEPIPVVHCPHCAQASRGKENAGWVPLPEKDLPLKLPKVKNYQPTETGESPLAAISKWVNTRCPKCKGPAKRETDTMPNWAGSSWYFYRYLDPKNSKRFADPKKLKYWMPVDWYNGGMEHTTLHLLYSRFWNKFLFDIGLAPTSEPYKKRTSHGFILAEDGGKMSKSRGNVVNPDDVVALHGADTFRLYEMFMGPFDQMISWSDNNIIGVRRFVEKIWRLQFKVSAKNEETDKKFDALLHKTVKEVGEDIESMSFNTAVSKLMILANEMESASVKGQGLTRKDFEMFLKILSPFAPHIAEEIWHSFGHKTLLVGEKWPEYDELKIKEQKTVIVVQVNGKVRAQFEASTDLSENEAKNKAISMPEVQKWLAGKEPQKAIFVPNKIINFVL